MGEEIDAYCHLGRPGLYVQLVLIALTRKVLEASNLVCAAVHENRLNVKNSAEQHAKERESPWGIQFNKYVSFPPLC